MKLTYLGTAAAEAWPALWCNCESCKTARVRRGKDIRTRSQALVGDDLLLDFPPDTYMHIINYGLDLDKVKNVLITHSHGDHIAPGEFGCRGTGMCSVHEDFVLQVYGNEAVQERCGWMVKAPMMKEHVQFHLLEPYKEYKIGDYTVYPMLADHGSKDENCFIYAIIDQEGKQLLYGHDTGYFPRPTWDFILEKGFKFDLVSLDCCAGALVGWWSNHMCYDACDSVKDRLIKCCNADENTVFVWNHFSHNCKVLGHDELVADGKQHGFEVSYDGKVMEF